MFCFQPKLSSAKSRLNVENFIAACRKLGVPEVRTVPHPDSLFSLTHKNKHETKRLKKNIPCATSRLVLLSVAVRFGLNKFSSKLNISPGQTLLHSCLHFVVLAFYCLSFDSIYPVCVCVCVPSPVQTEVCVCSDVLLCKLPAVLRCVTALLAVEAGETAEDTPPNHSSPASSSSSSSPSSLLSTDFLLFYCAVMALLYIIYCYLLT